MKYTVLISFFSIIAIMFLLCSCSTSGSQINDTTKNDYTESTIFEEISIPTGESEETTVEREYLTSAVDQSVEQTKNDEISDFAISFMIGLKDFYTLAETKSNDLSCYESLPSEGHLRYLIKIFPTEDAFVKLEDIGFENEGLLNSVNYVEIYFPDSSDDTSRYYMYVMKNATVTVRYYPEIYKSNDIRDIKDSKRSYVDGGFSACVSLKNADSIYTENVGDCVVSYEYCPIEWKNTGNYNLSIVANGLCVSISTTENITDSINDPSVTEIARFFSEDTYLDAVQQAIDGIKNRD